jgi:hypothetical protein
MGCNVEWVSPEAMRLLEAHPWNGNVPRTVNKR